MRLAKENTRSMSCSTSMTDTSAGSARSEEHTSELQSRQYLVCRLLLEKKKHILPKVRMIPTHVHEYLHPQLFTELKLIYWKIQVYIFKMNLLSRWHHLNVGICSACKAT